MFRKLFVDHPASVGENYFEHMGVAFSFGFKMMGAAFACIIHGLVPGLFKSTGSKAIICLHDRMVAHRCTKQIAPGTQTASHVAMNRETVIG